MPRHVSNVPSHTIFKNDNFSLTLQRKDKMMKVTALSFFFLLVTLFGIVVAAQEQVADGALRSHRGANGGLKRRLTTTKGSSDSTKGSSDSAKGSASSKGSESGKGSASAKGSDSTKGSASAKGSDSTKGSASPSASPSSSKGSDSTKGGKGGKGVSVSIMMRALGARREEEFS